MAPPIPVIDTLLAALAYEPSRPRFTGFTDAGRTELSGTVLLNWAAKVAGLLVDELGARHGDEVQVSSPANWQTAGILIGAWWAGLAVADQPGPRVIAAFVPPGGDAEADEVFVVSGHPLGLATRDLAPHQRDYTTSVLGQADRFTPRWAADPAAALRVGDRVLNAAALRSAVTAPSGITLHQRVLTYGAWTFAGRVPAVVELFIRPLSAGAAVIHSLDLNADAAQAPAWAHRAAVERADVTIGIDVGTLPRLG